MFYKNIISFFLLNLQFLKMNPVLYSFVITLLLTLPHPVPSCFQFLAMALHFFFKTADMHKYLRSSYSSDDRALTRQQQFSWMLWEWIKVSAVGSHPLLRHSHRHFHGSLLFTFQELNFTNQTPHPKPQAPRQKRGGKANIFLTNLPST